MINVLIVDDDAMVAELNQRYLEQVDGFRCLASVSTLQQAQTLITGADQPIDLVLLDIYMQQENGLDLLPTLRAVSEQTDVIIISSASDVPTVKKAMKYGVVDYLIKPFQFARFEQALIGYRQERTLLDRHEHVVQSEVDSLLRHTGAPGVHKRLPKGLTAVTLRTICEWIEQHQQQEFSTDTLANEIKISRVSCRKYLIYLAEAGTLHTSIFYGSAGRPAYQYRLLPDQLSALRQHSL